MVAALVVMLASAVIRSVALVPNVCKLAHGLRLFAVQLCLALSQMAKELRTASPKEQQKENPKFAMRTWLLRLGFIGEEFATAREILTRNLEGDTAFRFGRA